jgi:hypothetical protein
MRAALLRRAITPAAPRAARASAAQQHRRAPIAIAAAAPPPPPLPRPRRVAVAAARLFTAAAGVGAFAAFAAPRRAHLSAAAAAAGDMASPTPPRFELPPLPYAQDALEPHNSGRTLSFHHGKHHAAYVAGLNKALESSDAAGRFAGKDLEAIVKQSFKEDNADGPVFNNAGQVRPAGAVRACARAPMCARALNEAGGRTSSWQ